jgi:hypothetical protein
MGEQEQVAVGTDAIQRSRVPNLKLRPGLVGEGAMEKALGRAHAFAFRLGDMPRKREPAAADGLAACIYPLDAPPANREFDRRLQFNVAS